MYLEIGESSATNAAGFIGGHWVLPSGEALPSCGLCAAEQTFFLQVAFPVFHAWSPLALSVFACTRCVNENCLVPEMLDGPLPNAQPTAEFLTRYQRNFRLLTSRRESIRPAPIGSRSLRFSESPSDTTIGIIGGEPRWVLEDETPSRIAGHPAAFLFQLFGNLRFPMPPGGLPQQTLALDGSAEDSRNNFYELFLGNSLYFFGGNPSDGFVYVVTQVE
jgi:hypothetical protein